MKVFVLILLGLTACATGAPFRALLAEADLPARSVSFHPLGSHQPLARSAGQWARYREQIGLKTHFVTVTLKAETTGWMVDLRRDTPTGHEASIISLELSESSQRDPFLKALLRSTEHQVGKRGRVATKAGIFEQASARGGLRFHPRVPVFGLVRGRHGVYSVELIDFGLSPAPRSQ